MSPLHSRDKEAAGNVSFGLDPENMTDQDILAAMKNISGYLDITPGDFKEVYKIAYLHAHKRVLSTPVRQIMTSPVHFVHSDQPVLEVARLLAQVQVAGVPVVEKKDEAVVGVISEKDFMRRMAADTDQTFMALVAACMGSKGCPALKIKGQVAADIMSSPPITVSPDTAMHEIFELMREKNINRVPVLEKDRLVGIVSRDDLLGALAMVPGKK
ncbi:MAG: CBS domain-containing protein [Desulfovermiculus sp.]